FIRISFDLLIIHTWDGNWQLAEDKLPVEIGPDSLRLGLKGGPTLLYTTFSNVPYVNESRFQNFPSPIPGDQMPAQSGAKETDSHKRMESFAKLICGMDATVTWIEINVTPMPLEGGKAARLAKALSLDDRARQARDAAMKELLELGPQIEVFLRDERNRATTEG